MIGPSGAAYSLDRLIARQRGKDPGTSPRVGATVAIRLLQLHMCIIYLFAGMAKNGIFWEEGTAVWFSVANLEYQSMDLTWLAKYPYLVNFLTLATVWWEMSYIALVWPKFTRPLVILVAVAMHLGIALGMGLITFGLVMIFANMAFVSPRLVRAVVDPPLGRLATIVGARDPVTPAANDPGSSKARGRSTAKTRNRKATLPAA